jgi:hypothetical protein
MRLVQFLSENGERRVAQVATDERRLQVLAETQRVYDLALEAVRRGITLEELVSSRLRDEWLD